MTDAKTLSGSCLCGSVRITATTQNRKLSACHCGMCRKWGGGPFIALDCGTDLTIEGQEHVAVFDSSEWAERAFCSKCGTHLFYRIKDSNEHGVLAGILDNGSDFELGLQYFIDKKPDYYSFANKTATLTEAQVMEMFAPKTDE